MWNFILNILQIILFYMNNLDIMTTVLKIQLEVSTFLRLSLFSRPLQLKVPILGPDDSAATLGFAIIYFILLAQQMALIRKFFSSSKITC